MNAVFYMCVFVSVCVKSLNHYTVEVNLAKKCAQTDDTTYELCARNHAHTNTHFKQNSHKHIQLYECVQILGSIKCVISKCIEIWM